MPPVVAARWSAIEELSRSAGPICDRVLAQAECPLEPDHLPHPEASPIVRLPESALIGAPEVRQVEVFCEIKHRSEEHFTRSCYLQHYFGPHSPQRDAAWTCDKYKAYPGWEHPNDWLAFFLGIDALYTVYGQGCHENLYQAGLLRRTPAGNTINTRVHFYVDGHAPVAAPATEVADREYGDQQERVEEVKRLPGELEAEDPRPEDIREEPPARRVEGTVKAGAPSVHGPMDPSLVKGEVQVRIVVVKACYRLALKQDRKLDGKMKVRWTISTEGRVSDIEIAEDSLGDDEVSSCIKRGIGRFRFPPPTASVDVVFPFTFEAK